MWTFSSYIHFLRVEHVLEEWPWLILPSLMLQDVSLAQMLPLLREPHLAYHLLRTERMTVVSEHQNWKRLS